MTVKQDDGHEAHILDLMRENDLFAVDTLFKPRTKSGATDTAPVTPHTGLKTRKKGHGNSTTYVFQTDGSH